MADDGNTELEGGGGASAVTAGPSVAADAEIEIEAQLREAAHVLRQRGQRSTAGLALLLVRLRLDAALWLLGDDRRLEAVDGHPALFDEFRRSVVSIDGHVRYVPLLRRAGYDEHEVSRVFRHMVLWAAQRAAGLIPPVDDDEPYRNGGFGAVPATAAAVRSLEKQTFRAATAAAAGGNGGDAITECGICFDEFVDGAEVSVMPCPCRGHRFHPECITKWLGMSNMCPLCRHKLPATGVYDHVISTPSTGSEAVHGPRRGQEHV